MLFPFPIRQCLFSCWWHWPKRINILLIRFSWLDFHVSYFFPNFFYFNTNDYFRLSYMSIWARYCSLIAQFIPSFMVTSCFIFHDSIIITAHGWDNLPHLVTTYGNIMKHQRTFYGIIRRDFAHEINIKSTSWPFLKNHPILKMWLLTNWGLVSNLVHPLMR